MIIDYKNNLHKATDILGDNVYYGNGQGYGTIWYKSIEHFKKVVKKLGKIPEVPKGLCKKCSCSYSYGTKKWKQYPEFNCRKWKKDIVNKKPCEVAPR